MSPTSTEIAEAFSRHDFDKTYPYMRDDVEWNLIGERQLRGKTEVVSTCEESAEYLTDIRTIFSSFRSIIGGNSVVIDSRAEYIDSQNRSTHIASCDIYDFIDGNLATITSYTRELNSSPASG